ncbi:hypothetical protein IWW34DRAFT_135007 [Fusarium oxysporum f. sp. albedinis]|nr:hypothetical protein IWW34DRAFT_135007 [Fusarium oxysporum f. sp. albedinis]
MAKCRVSKIVDFWWCFFFFAWRKGGVGERVVVHGRSQSPSAPTPKSCFEMSTVLHGSIWRKLTWYPHCAFWPSASNPIRTKPNTSPTLLNVCALVPFHSASRHIVSLYTLPRRQLCESKTCSILSPAGLTCA